MSDTCPETLEDLTDPQILERIQDLDTLMVEARGDHPALADARRTIGSQLNLVLTEAARRGLAVVEPF